MSADHKYENLRGAELRNHLLDEHWHRSDLTAIPEAGLLQLHQTRHKEGEREGNMVGWCVDCGEPVWWGHGETQHNLVVREGRKWCYGPDRQRVEMTHWHALPGMPQYIAPSREGQTCHCLQRAGAHRHLIAGDPGPGWDIKMVPVKRV